MPSLPESLLISVRQAGVDSMADRLLLVLVVSLMIAAWWLETPYNLYGLAILVLLAWGVPWLIHGRDRAARAAAAAAARGAGGRRFNPASLCAQARSPACRCPDALLIDARGRLKVRWDGQADWQPAHGLRILQLGPLLQLRFVASPPAPLSSLAAAPADQALPAGPTGQQPLAVRQGDMNGGAARREKGLQDGGVESAAIAPITYAGPASTDAPAEALCPEAGLSGATCMMGQAGSCLLWIPRLPVADAVALRRWLLWQQRGGSAFAHDASTD